MTDDWHVRVDRARCMGTTICASTAPNGFEIDERGQSRPAVDVVAPDETVMNAARLCPVEAISIALAGSGEELFPGDG